MILRNKGIGIGVRGESAVDSTPVGQWMHEALQVPVVPRMT